MSVVRLCKRMSIRHVAKFYALSWTTLKHIDKRLLARELACVDLQGVRMIAMDEFAIHKGVPLRHSDRRSVLQARAGAGVGWADMRPFFELLEDLARLLPCRTCSDTGRMSLRRPCIKLAQCLLWLGPALLPTAAGANAMRLCLHEARIMPYLSADSAHPGLLERLLMDSAKEAGVMLEIQRQPLLRCRKAIEDGSMDLALLADNPANRAIAHFPLRGDQVDANRRALRMQIVVVRRRGESKPGWDGLHFEPSAPAIGIRRGIQSYQDLLARLRLSADDAATDGDQLLRKLVDGRVDAALISRGEFDYLQTRAPRQLEILPIPFAEIDYFLGLSRHHSTEHRSLIEAWWATLARMRDLPEYRAPSNGTR